MFISTLFVPAWSRALLRLSFVCGLLAAGTMAQAAADNSLAGTSVRGQVGVGDQALQMSFTIEGTSAKSVLVRGLGPALAMFGVPGTLANPMVAVHDASGAIVASNDDWGGSATLSSAFSNVGAFAIQQGSRDAALLATLTPGTYTARVTGVNDATGTALLEVYDNDSTPRLPYATARQHVGTGNNTLILGFVLTGTAPQAVLVRALGPALGMTGALANPTLTVNDSGGGVRGQNDNWSGTEVANAAATAGLMPLATGSADSAILLTLAPGSYIVQVSGVGNTTGFALCEIALVDGRPTTIQPALLTVPTAISATAGASLSIGAPSIGKPAPGYQWRKGGTPIAGATGSSYTIASVDAASAGSYSVVLTNSAGAVTSQPWTVATGQGGAAPTITTQPASQTVQTGTAAVFGVTAAGPGPFTFQWSKDGTPIPNDTSSIYSVRSQGESSALTVFNTSAQSAGTYRVVVTNLNGSVTSQNAVLTVAPRQSLPALLSQPSELTVTVGTAAELRVTATGNPAPTYQWFKDGQPVAGATNATLTLASAQLTDSGVYFVNVTNSLGTVMSASATLTVTSTPLAPSIVTRPADVTAPPGGSAQFAVTAAGTSPRSYQWFKDGVPIPGRTAVSMFLAGVRPEDAGAYTVVVTNAAGSITSPPARLTVTGYHGPAAYFGTLGAGAGTFGLHVTAENTAMFLGFVSATRTPIIQRTVTIGADGRFSFPVTALGANATLSGTIEPNGVISGMISGAGLALSGARAEGTASARTVAGFYQAGEVNGAGMLYAIVSASGRSYVLTAGAGAADAGMGGLNATGALVVITAANATLTGTLSAESATLTARWTAINNAVSEFIGGSETRPAIEKLVNISTRGRVGTGADVLIAGFVISGDAPRQILVRGIGPSLAGFNVSGALATPRLEVTSGTTTVATNTGWRTAQNTAEIPAATVRAGAFPLAATSNDSVLLLTLPPGGYTAVVSGVNNTTGVALVEVYDVSETPAPGRKVINLSARAVAGGGDETLIAGCNITGELPKRVLVRAVGPTLANDFRVPGTLADPQVRIVRAADQAVVAANDNWSEGGGAALVAEAAAAVGAFALGANSRDAALLISLPPGGYSVVVTGTGAASGVALVEIYEVP